MSLRSFCTDVSHFWNTLLTIYDRQFHTLILDRRSIESKPLTLATVALVMRSTTSLSAATVWASSRYANSTHHI